MHGADVALLQRDLNVWYAYWGAPAREMLDQDGDLGARTELAFRRVRFRLGLEPRQRGDVALITARDRLIVRHLGRWLRARQHGETYEIPTSVTRTPAEIARGKQAQAYEHRLRARFKQEQAQLADLRPEVSRNVVNQSTRHGLKPRIIVLHTTEGHNRPGLSDLQGLASFFDSPNNQVSSHIANDAEGHDARMVPDERKAWTQAAFNSVSLSIEQIGQAAQTEWNDAQLDNTARWIAHWSKKWGIPITHSTDHGVCQHSDLGAKGGGHHDCGQGYPFARVLAKARQMA
jgi:N-acetyl-anhydromuramyl-L-alanine amidase AmpD